MPVQTPDIQIGDAYHAATVHQMHRTLRGYGWVSGDAATPGPGVALTVPSDTTMWIDGSEVDVGSGDNVANLLPHDRHPRWVSVVVNANGVVEAIHGDVDRPKEVNGVEITGRSAARPSPPIVTDSDRVLHSLVWVPANAGSIDPEFVVDRRVDARVDALNFTLDTYEDADAIAAIEGQDPLEPGGAVNVGGDMTIDGTLIVDDVDGIDSPEYTPTGSRTSAPSDDDWPLIYRTGNAGTDEHPRHGDLNLVARTSVSAAVRLLAGTPDPQAVLQANADGTVDIPNGGLSVDGTIEQTGDQVATRFWANDNLVQNGTGSEYEIQKDGNDGDGVINFKTS